MISEGLLSRLVCAKLLFENGADTFSRGAPFAPGIAILAFQDSVEMMLRAVAEHIHAQIKDNAAFNQLLDEIDAVGVALLTHRTVLIQLNRARVNFKHLGLAPRDEDVRKFRADVEGFFQATASNFFSLDAKHISTSFLVRHRRTRNWIERAEQANAEESFQDSVCASAVALAVFLKSDGQSDDYRSGVLGLRVDSSSREVLSLAKEVSEEVGEAIKNLHRQLDLVSHGISLDDHRKFRHIAPIVHLMVSGNFQMNLDRSIGPTQEEASFCLSFVRDAVLKLQQAFRVNKFGGRPGNQTYFTTQETSIFVYPPKDGRSEVIEVVAEGLEFGSFSNEKPVDGYVPIIYQGDRAFLPASAVTSR